MFTFTSGKWFVIFSDFIPSHVNLFFMFSFPEIAHKFTSSHVCLRYQHRVVIAYIGPLYCIIRWFRFQPVNSSDKVFNLSTHVAKSFTCQFFLQRARHVNSSNGAFNLATPPSEHLNLSTPPAIISPVHTSCSHPVNCSCESFKLLTHHKKFSICEPLAQSITVVNSFCRVFNLSNPSVNNSTCHPLLWIIPPVKPFCE